LIRHKEWLFFAKQDVIPQGTEAKTLVETARVAARPLDCQLVLEAIPTSLASLDFDPSGPPWRRPLPMLGQRLWHHCCAFLQCVEEQTRFRQFVACATPIESCKIYARIVPCVCHRDRPVPVRADVIVYKPNETTQYSGLSVAILVVRNVYKLGKETRLSSKEL